MIKLKPLSSQPMQQGFSLFEVLIAALILAVAVAGVMGLHTRNLQDTAANDELQRAYWVVFNAQQRSQLNHSLSEVDKSDLIAQANTAGLGSAQIIDTGRGVGLHWHAWYERPFVQCRGCKTGAGKSCNKVKVK